MSPKFAQRSYFVYNFYDKKISIVSSPDHAENYLKTLFFGHPILSHECRSILFSLTPSTSSFPWAWWPLAVEDPWTWIAGDLSDQSTNVWWPMSRKPVKTALNLLSLLCGFLAGRKKHCVMKLGFVTLSNTSRITKSKRKKLDVINEDGSLVKYEFRLKRRRKTPRTTTPILYEPE